MVYRSARLDRYDTDAFRDELIDWIRSTRLKAIVDLRTDEEVVAAGYSPAVLSEVQWVRLPVTTNLPDIDSSDEDPERVVRAFYARLPMHESFKAALRGVFTILSEPNRRPAVLHCRAGTDRTGMVVAILLDAVGVNRGAILRDYLLSHGHTAPEYLGQTFRAIESAGGLSAYLEAAGVLPKDLGRVRQALVARAEDSHSNEARHNPLNGAPRS